MYRPGAAKSRRKGPENRGFWQFPPLRSDQAPLTPWRGKPASAGSYLVGESRDEVAGVRHPHLRQRLRIDHVLFVDEFVEEKDVSGQIVDFLVTQRSRLNPGQ